MFIYPYRKGSASVKALREEGFRMIRIEGSKFKPTPKKKVVNWGSSNFPEEYLECQVLNAPQGVRKAACKLQSFKALAEHGVSVPRFTEDPEEALSWGKDVVVRHKLNGHSGEGIEIVEKGVDELPEAPLYVEYVKKKEEYRVHVFLGKVIDVQRKARSLDVPDDEVNWQVRNLKGGFIYARAGARVEEDMRIQALASVKALGLDFGAVDIVYNNYADTYYVLEVNTAPGLTGTTLEKYSKALRDWSAGKFNVQEVDPGRAPRFLERGDYRHLVRAFAVDPEEAEEF